MAVKLGFYQLTMLCIVLLLITNAIRGALLDRNVELDKRQKVAFDHCPNGSVRHDDSCYLVSHDLASWTDALVFCEAYGAHLARIDSDREQTFIAGHLKSILASVTDPLHYFWIGGTDAVSEGEWYWARIVQPVTYTHWGQGQPDNAHTHSSHHQDCMAIFGATGAWDDGWCEDRHNFICEIKYLLTGTLFVYNILSSVAREPDGHLYSGNLQDACIGQQAVLDHCPNGSVIHDESCYLVSHDLADWIDANGFCEVYGAHLARIDSEREQTFIAGHLKSILASTTDPGHYFWIGGTDAVSEGEWYWAKIVQPVTYTHWKPGEPNNNPAHATHHQDCMAIYGETGFWDDGWCETKHNFICEINLTEEVTSIVG